MKDAEKALARLQDAALTVYDRFTFDVLMGGPRFMGFNCGQRSGRTVVDDVLALKQAIADAEAVTGLQKDQLERWVRNGSFEPVPRLPVEP